MCSAIKRGDENAVALLLGKLWIVDFTNRDLTPLFVAQIVVQFVPTVRQTDSP